jgi:hypothetical protein
MPHLTPKGKRAEERLEKLMKKREGYNEHLTRLNGADERDRLDSNIDFIEGNFADPEDPAGYWVKVRASRRARAHVRRR